MVAEDRKQKLQARAHLKGMNTKGQPFKLQNNRIKGLLLGFMLKYPEQ